jgi:hypothetical protein
MANQISPASSTTNLGCQCPSMLEKTIPVLFHYVFISFWARNTLWFKVFVVIAIDKFEGCYEEEGERGKGVNLRAGGEGLGLAAREETADRRQLTHQQAAAEQRKEMQGRQASANQASGTTDFFSRSVGWWKRFPILTCTSSVARATHVLQMHKFHVHFKLL